MRFRFSLPALPSARADPDEAGTDWPAAISLDPLSDLEGFEEEHRRWWLRTARGADFDADEARAETMPVWGVEETAEATTRRIDEGNIVLARSAQSVACGGRVEEGVLG